MAWRGWPVAGGRLRSPGPRALSLDAVARTVVADARQCCHRSFTKTGGFSLRASDWAFGYVGALRSGRMDHEKRRRLSDCPVWSAESRGARQPRSAVIITISDTRWLCLAALRT